MHDITRHFHVYQVLYPVNFPLFSGLPCYIGKGSGSRARISRDFTEDANQGLALIAALSSAPLVVEIIKDQLSETEALDLEVELINSIKQVKKGGSLVNQRIKRGGRHYNIFIPKPSAERLTPEDREMIAQMKQFAKDEKIRVKALREKEAEELWRQRDKQRRLRRRARRA